MTDRTLTVETVRLALGNKTNARGYRVFSDEARAQAMAYARAHIEAGASMKEVTTELGLNDWTLQRWLQNQRRGAVETAAGFVKLEVKPSRVEAVLHGPCGVWVKGLGIDGIAAVLRSLACSD